MRNRSAAERKKKRNKRGEHGHVSCKATGERSGGQNKEEDSTPWVRQRRRSCLADVLDGEENTVTARLLPDETEREREGREDAARRHLYQSSDLVLCGLRTSAVVRTVLKEYR